MRTQWLFVIVLFTLGLGLLGYNWSQQHKAWESRQWPTVQGQVISTGMAESSDDNGVAYAPIVRYTYEVDGVEYQSSRIAFGPTEYTSSRRKVAQVLARYPEGSAVTVHYNPNDPHEAVLETQVQGSLVFTLIGGLMVIMGFWELGKMLRVRAEAL